MKWGGLIRAALEDFDLDRTSVASTTALKCDLILPGMVNNAQTFQFSVEDEDDDDDDIWCKKRMIQLNIFQMVNYLSFI